VCSSVDLSRPQAPKAFASSPHASIAKKWAAFPSV
jgi:hypothetical protein